MVIMRTINQHGGFNPPPKGEMMKKRVSPYMMLLASIVLGCTSVTTATAFQYSKGGPPEGGAPAGWKEVRIPPGRYALKFKQVSVGSDGTVWGLAPGGRGSVHGHRFKLDVLGVYSTELVRQIRVKVEATAYAFKQISIGNANHIWAVSTGNQIFKMRTGSDWERKPDSFKQVSVGSDGTVRGVSKHNEIWEWTASGWKRAVGFQVPGGIKQISVGSEHRIWGVAPNNLVYRWTGSGWEKKPGSLKQVSVGSDGTVWGVNKDKEIRKWTGSDWEKKPGTLNQISVGSAKHVWGVKTDGRIYRLIP